MTQMHPDLPADPQADARAWREGFHTGLPTLFGIGAWGMVVGVAMVKSGLTVAQASGMTLVAFAGSAQLASLPLIAAGAPIWVIFLTALVVNLRFVIFSALLGPHFSRLPLWQRFYLGYISGDVSIALFLQRYPSPAPEPGKLAILCIMVPLIINSAALCGVLVAGVTAVLAHGLPYKLGLLAAVVAGMLTAMVCQETMEKRRRKGSGHG